LNYCHHVQGLRAIVHYKAVTGRDFQGSIAELEVRDQLPDTHQESDTGNRQQPLAGSPN
jgi:hypothetical protein